MSTWVVTPCKRERVSEALNLFRSLDHDPAYSLVVTTRPDTIQPEDLEGQHLITYEEPGMLYGAWGNLAFDWIAERETAPWEVLYIGSSCTGRSDSVLILARALRQYDLAMVGPDMFGRLEDKQVDIHQHDKRTIGTRVTPEAMMVAGKLGLRFDPQFRWYSSDDDLDMQARQIKSVGLVGGTGIVYGGPHALDEVQSRWAKEDLQKFITKWGDVPWCCTTPSCPGCDKQCA